MKKSKRKDVTCYLTYQMIKALQEDDSFDPKLSKELCPGQISNRCTKVFAKEQIFAEPYPVIATCSYSIFENKTGLPQDRYNMVVLFDNDKFINAFKDRMDKPIIVKCGRYGIRDLSLRERYSFELKRANELQSREDIMVNLLDRYALLFGRVYINPASVIYGNL